VVSASTWRRAFHAVQLARNAHPSVALTEDTMAAPQPQQPQPGAPQQGQIQVPAQPNPALQAIIDQSFVPIDISFGAEPYITLCGPHKEEKCKECGVDFLGLNRVARLLATNPGLRCPPPPNAMTSKQLTQAVTQMKEDGNVCQSYVGIWPDANITFQKQFKEGKNTAALARYNAAAAVAAQRPPWEAPALMREELSVVLANRAAAHLADGDFISALADAETVITIRGNWARGHLRKAKALVGLKDYKEAILSAKNGLLYEATNAVSSLRNLILVRRKLTAT